MPMSHKQAWHLTRHKMPISKARDIARKAGKICLRCLLTPVHRGRRCKRCYEIRREDNKTRKR